MSRTLIELFLLFKLRKTKLRRGARGCVFPRRVNIFTCALSPGRSSRARASLTFGPVRSRCRSLPLPIPFCCRSSRCRRRLFPWRFCLTWRGFSAIIGEIIPRGGVDHGWCVRSVVGFVVVSVGCLGASCSRRFRARGVLRSFFGRVVPDRVVVFVAVGCGVVVVAFSGGASLGAVFVASWLGRCFAAAWSCGWCRGAAVRASLACVAAVLCSCWWFFPIRRVVRSGVRWSAVSAVAVFVILCFFGGSSRRFFLRTITPRLRSKGPFAASAPAPLRSAPLRQLRTAHYRRLRGDVVLRRLRVHALRAAKFGA